MSLALSGCGAEEPSSDAPTVDPSRSTSAQTSGTTAPHVVTQPITVTRTGGLAGVQDTWTVDVSGRWQATSRGQAARSGQVTAEQVKQLNAQLANPELLTELGKLGNSGCSDAFSYSVQIGSGRYELTGCGQSRPAFDRLTALLLTLTS
ncbi:hypothetical protein AB0M43_35960 [Longispora sp. NPDC051575]|uniref:hypothetical protein n=1 Tax=Longispora sp. NPDC051575 TaxID=3154943 RepID=UPI00341F5627